MMVIKTHLDGVCLIEPKVFPDSRGYFFECFQQQRYLEEICKVTFVQDNISRSQKNVLRGLHYQLEKPQDKLMTVIRGAIFDVAVDVRRGSSTFGQWYGHILSDENHLQMFIPKGFAHGFCVLSDEVDILYKCSDYYHPASEHGVLWSDPDVGIPWQVQNPILSAKDEKYPLLKNVPAQFLPEMQ